MWCPKDNICPRILIELLSTNLCNMHKYKPRECRQVTAAGIYTNRTVANDILEYEVWVHFKLYYKVYYSYKNDKPLCQKAPTIITWIQSINISTNEIQTPLPVFPSFAAFKGYNLFCIGFPLHSIRPYYAVAIFRLLICIRSRLHLVTSNTELNKINWINLHMIMISRKIITIGK